MIPFYFIWNLNFLIVLTSKELFVFLASPLLPAARSCCFSFLLSWDWRGLVRRCAVENIKFSFIYQRKYCLRAMLLNEWIKSSALSCWEKTITNMSFKSRIERKRTIFHLFSNILIIFASLTQTSDDGGSRVPHVCSDERQTRGDWWSVARGVEMDQVSRECWRWRKEMEQTICSLLVNINDCARLGIIGSI